jgi:tetratricopeptide (TPR) repeat protein
MGPPDDVPAQGRTVEPFSALALTAAVAAVTFLVAYDGGTFGLTSRGTLAIGVWWVVLLAVAAGLWPLAGLDRTTLLAGGLLAALAGLTLSSVIWADSAEISFDEFNRTALYVGVFALAALAARRGHLARWSDGFALGIVGIAGLAFFSRCFPDVLLTYTKLGDLPLDLTRLSYPLGYWNGLAILAALAVPLLLRLAGSDSHPALRAVALVPFPILASVVYLASSRGGLATAVVGTLALLALIPRMRMLEGVVLAAAGSAAGIVAVAPHDTLVNHPGLGAAGQGHVVFGLVAAACAATGVAAYFLYRFAGAPLERRTAAVGVAGRVAAAVVVVAVIAAGVVAAHPVRLFDHFKAPPPDAVNTLPSNSSNPINVHILSAGSSGRWQQWGSVIDEFRSAPALGRGAGSYEAWWAQHGTLKGFVQDAHSLYLETLGELGIVGFLLIVGAFLTGLVAGARRALAARGEARLAIAALWAGFVAYAFGAGIDWMWELPAVSVVGIAFLGLLTARAAAPEPARAVAIRRRWDVTARVVLGLTGVAVILAQGISLLTNREIHASQNAAARGDVVTAFKRADNARKIEPWASSPYEQLALVAEQDGEYGDAQGWIRKAIARDPSDWQSWFLWTRFSTEAGDIRAARSHFHRARELNPRSPVLAKASVHR